MTIAKADKVIDGRNMESPESFIQIMEALDAIEPGQKLLLRLMRESFALYRALELNGVPWQTERMPDEPCLLALIVADGWRRCWFVASNN